MYNVHILNKQDKTMDDLTNDELDILYRNYITYRDKACRGWAKIGVCEFYDTYKLKPMPVSDYAVHGRKMVKDNG